jgi:hypothetical protein
VIVATIDPLDAGLEQANLSTARDTVCPQPTFIETTVNAMTIQLNNWVRNDFGIVLVFGDEKRADFGDKSETWVDKIDELVAKFWLLFIILIIVF